MELPIPHNFFVYFGPPGTGKTRTLAAAVSQFAALEGPDSLLLCSYTKTGAQQLVQQGLPVRRIGTLHSHCWRGLDRPTIAETLWKQWNTAYPYMPLSAPREAQGLSADDAAVTLQRGDLALAQVNLLRATCVPASAWPGTLHHFAACWTDWKQQHHARDFTDIITDALAVLPIAPGHPQTLILDEAQDFSLLQWQLLQRWSLHTTRVIAAGDDDQALYRHTGADFRPLLGSPHKYVLHHSYRVPQRVYPHAIRYVQAIKLRQAKTWTASAVHGTVRTISGVRRDPAAIVPLCDDLQHSPRTLALLATCGYFLTPFLAVLRANGIPFGNPWRPTAAAWNPLQRSSGTGQVTALERLLAYLCPPARLWTWRELALWTGLLRHGVLPSAIVRQLLAQQDREEVCTLPALEALLPAAVRLPALTHDLRWVTTQASPGMQRTLGYPARVASRYGREALVVPPAVIVGTCHSLKGGEADDVLLLTQLSPRAHSALAQGSEAADDVWRTLYVGVTRAKERLFLC